VCQSDVTEKDQKIILGVVPLAVCETSHIQDLLAKSFLGLATLQRPASNFWSIRMVGSEMQNLLALPCSVLEMLRDRTE
jgi:hypothetical protein